MTLLAPWDFSNIWTPAHKVVDAKVEDGPPFQGHELLGSTYLVTFFKFEKDNNINYEDHLIIFYGLATKVLPCASLIGKREIKCFIVFLEIFWAR